MARVIVHVEEVEIENDDGNLVPGVEATCSECKNQGTAFGTHQGSVTRAIMEVKNTCPRRGRKPNFYVEG